MKNLDSKVEEIKEVKQQVKMVKNVKRHLSYIIENPYVINKDESIEDLIKLNENI